MVLFGWVSPSRGDAVTGVTGLPIALEMSRKVKVQTIGRTHHTHHTLAASLVGAFLEKGKETLRDDRNGAGSRPPEFWAPATQPQSGKGLSRLTPA